MNLELAVLAAIVAILDDVAAAFAAVGHIAFRLWAPDPLAAGARIVSLSSRS